MMAANGWCVTAIYRDALLAFYDQELYVAVCEKELASS
jgi:hypothetical protein